MNGDVEHGVHENVHGKARKTKIKNTFRDLRERFHGFRVPYHFIGRLVYLKGDGLCVSRWARTMQGFR
jgi:hypothetical protein